MNLWNKIVLGAKFMFGGFEAAIDYLLELLNSFLGKDNVSAKIKELLDFVTKILGYMTKYEKYCPAIWTKDFLKLKEVIQTFVDILDDEKVTPEEVEKAIETVKSAIEEWMR